MTSHELANKLLKLPDSEIKVTKEGDEVGRIDRIRFDGWSDTDDEAVNSTVYLQVE